MTTFAIPNEKRHLFDGKKWFDSLAQLVEHNTFNVGVLGSSPKRITKFFNSASLAQLVEHDTLNVGVQGSSP